jgi:hypothetical protein
MRGLVFGTLLGPEATGPLMRVVVPFEGAVRLCGRVLFVSGFLAARIMRGWLLFGAGVWGVWYGVVV